ncbi:hypothetical protein ACBR40_29905 [Nonomuraea sp. AD125B]|uniref:hypothetical protein n=1 Tax=Nonomuraea sp. AD125B TaxID=3242897 RepID=UPI00352737E8
MDIEISVMVNGAIVWLSSSIQALVDSTPLPSTSAWRKKSLIPQRMCGVIDPDHHKPAATHISTTQMDTADGNCLRGATPNCRFATLTGLEVTSTSARQVIDHFAGLRRWRLAAVVLAAPVRV